MDVSTIGLDIAKSVFQVHGVDAAGEVVVRRRLRRRQLLGFFEKLGPCLVGIEACATAHYWGREIAALGHEVRLMPAHYVKAYVKRGKNDAADAEAICEAVQRPTMRFVSLKSTEQQSMLMLHRTRELLVRQRTMLVNALRAHMAEFGIVTRVGLPQIKELLAVIADKDDHRLPLGARACLESLGRQFLSLHEEICVADKRLHAWHRSNPVSQRALQPYPASDRLRRARWQPPLPILRCSSRAARWRPGLDLCRGRTRQVESSGLAKSPNRATSICDGCSSPEP